MVLSFGEMLDADAPDPDIWLDDEALHTHFEALKQKRNEGRAPDDDKEEWEENAAAAAVLKQIGA